MRNGTRLAMLVGVPVLLIAVGAVLAALVWMQQRSDLAVEQAGSDTRRTAAGTAAVTAQAPAPAVAGRQAVPVRRGSIAEQLSLNGRVAASDEVSLGFAQPGRIETVAVKPGDLVEAGQLLVESDASLIERDLVAARGRLELGSLRFEQAQQSTQARQRDAERRKSTDATRREEGVRGAESALRRAQADYDRVKAGASPAERRAAETAVSNATAALERAEAEYYRAFTPNEIEIRQADQTAATARLNLQKAEADLAKAGQPDPEVIRAAERELQTAQTAYARAVADISRLTQPDPSQLAEAERELYRAEVNLRAAQSQRTTDRASRAARESSVINAQLALEAARERLDKVRAGAPEFEVQSAQRGLIAARQAVDQARERLDRSRAAPPQLSVDQAQNAVETARLAVEAADYRAAVLRAGPPEDTVARLASSVQQAQASLLSARQQLNDLNARPARAELQDAEERLALAQQAVERARADAEQEVAQEVDTSAYDLQVIERSIAQDRAQVEKLEQQLATARLRAPFAGTVSGIKVRAGDPFEAERPIIILARPGDPVLRADIAERDANRLSIGQRAVARFEEGFAGEIDATVDAVMEGDGGFGRVAQFQAVWPSPVPPLGMPVQIAITLREKDNVLLVPQRAIRSAGTRRFVEVQDGPNRTMTDVEVGIVANGQAEIVNGLRQDQLVLVGP